MSINKAYSIVTTISLILIVLFCAENVSAQSAVDVRVDSLFIIASSGEIKYRDMVAPAIDSLAAMGSAAVPKLIDLYDTKVARERHALNNILVKIGSEAVPDLVKALDNNDNPELLSRYCYTLGNIKDSAAVDGLLGKTNHDDWGVRSNAVAALGKIGSSRAGDKVILALADTVESVRKSATVAAGRLMLYDAIPNLVHMLGDSFYGARMTAAEALIKMADSSIYTVSDSLVSESELVGNLGITVLGRIGGDAAAYRIGQELQSESPLRRALAAEALFNANSSLGCGFIEVLRADEQDSTVIFYMDRALEKYAP